MNEQTPYETHEPEHQPNPAPAQQPTMAAAPEASETAVQTPERKHKLRGMLRPENILIPSLRRKLGAKARPVAIVIIILVLAGIGGGAYALFGVQHPVAKLNSSFNAPVVRFALTSTAPEKDATGVNLSSKITLNFNQPVKAEMLTNNVFFTPKIDGSFSQGANTNQVIFTPSKPLQQGIKYTVMINQTTQSTAGATLPQAIQYGFTTSIPDDSVLISDSNGYYDNLSNLRSGEQETYTVYLGRDVGDDVTVNLYKTTIDTMLASLVTNADDGTGYIDSSVSTSGLTSIATYKNIKDAGSFDVQQPEGTYVAVATDNAGKQVGTMWISVSNIGVMIRQDDQKTVLSSQSLDSNDNLPVTATFYSLRGKVQNLGTAQINGLTTTSYGYDDNLDVIVASANGKTAVVPVNAYYSGGHIRVEENLSQALAAFATTDKPTYAAGDAIRLAGFVRQDEDALFKNPGARTITLYVSSPLSASPYAKVSASVDSTGRFTASIPSSATWLGKETTGNFAVRLQNYDDATFSDQTLTRFSLTTGQSTPNGVTVSFAKSSYVPSDQIAATITAKNADGSAMAGKTLTVHTYAKAYYENNLLLNSQNFGVLGDEIKTSPSTVTLDGNGRATVTVKAADLPNSGSSQTVTIGVGLNDTNVSVDSAIVHQANDYLTFAPNRTLLPDGEDYIQDVYVSKLDGSSEPGATVKYSLQDYNGANVFQSGSVTADMKGLATITVPASTFANLKTAVVLDASVTDRSGNTALAETVPYGSSDAGRYDTSGAGLYDLNVRGTSGSVAVGDTVTLHISSPKAIRAMLTMDRSRIYKPQMIDLKQGDNTYSFTVTADLAPSFMLTFNYFLNGVYHSEGVPFTVTNDATKAAVSIKPVGTVAAGQSATFTVATATQSGNPLTSNVIVDVISADSLQANKEVTPDIYTTFYVPRPIMTSSSSSLTPIGSGGGGCGGGYALPSEFNNPIGTVAYWNPSLKTGSDGTASLSFTAPKGTWIINAYAASSDGIFGSQSSTITVN